MIERERHGLEMEKERQIGLAELQLFHYLLAAHIQVSGDRGTQFPMLCIAKACKY